MKHYGDFVSMGGLKEMADSFKQSVKPMDILVGAVVGRVGGAMLNGVINQQFAGKIPAAIAPYTKELSMLLVGGGLFIAQKGSARAKGHLVGAAGAAVVPLVADIVVTQAKALKIPGFGALVEIQSGYSAGPMGYLEPSYGYLEPSMNGFNAFDEAYSPATADLEAERYG